MEAAFSVWYPDKVLADVFKSNMDNAKEGLNNGLFTAWVHNMWQQKTQPQNPKIQATNAAGQVDIESTYIVQEIFKVQATSIAEFATQLQNMDVPAPVIEAITSSGEVDFTPFVTTRDIKEMVKGRQEGEAWIEATPAEKDVATKLLTFIKTLTPEEQGLILKREADVNIKKGFLNRLPNYVQSEEQLAKVLMVVKPTAYPKGAKFGVSDSITERNTRLVAAASEILGAAVADEE